MGLQTCHPYVTPLLYTSKPYGGFGWDTKRDALKDLNLGQGAAAETRPWSEQQLSPPVASCNRGKLCWARRLQRRQLRSGKGVIKLPLSPGAIELNYVTESRKNITMNCTATFIPKDARGTGKENIDQNWLRLFWKNNFLTENDNLIISKFSARMGQTHKNFI